MLLLDSTTLEARAAVCRSALAPLHASLRAELEPVLDRRPEVPRLKALLSRAGGRCERDGAHLEFDPWSAHEHRCPVCGTVHRGEVHERAWVTSYQLWLAERCLQAALFHLLGGDARQGAFARDTLRQYADRYLQFPNRDNVLGPTRLFFSTYLESIWLLQVCLATSFLAHAGDAETVDVVRERIVEPSSALIAEYDEGMSNRQVWNNAALIAAALLVGDRGRADQIIEGPSGLHAHLSHALLPDGTWYEGENYHQFALRGLWYGVALCEASGRQLPAQLRRRFDAAFVAPYLTALPDFTLPSRKDSQYAVSLRQWRIAELTELGYARSGDARLATALSRCYEPGHERGDTGRWRSTADVERNTPSTGLTRTDLGWRALLFALPELPVVASDAPRSAILEGQGIAVFRRADDIYAALDYGQSGGGHGHPDRLNVTLAVGSRRILDDLGTGSYVDPSLYWYRSTLAHNAPLADGHSQKRGDGVLRAYDEREAVGWIVAEFVDGDAAYTRAVVVAPDYLIDELRWTGRDTTRVELPWHFDAETELALSAATLDGGNALEDGFEFTREVRSANVPRGRTTVLSKLGARAYLNADGDTTLFSACGPGQPATSMRRFYVLRGRGARGRFRAVFSWTDAVSSVDFHEDRVEVVMHEAERHVHRGDASGWHVELLAAGARSSIDLAGWREPTPRTEATPVASPVPIVIARASRVPSWLSEAPAGMRATGFSRSLDAAHYRRSEESWAAAGEPRADALITATREALVILLEIRAGDPRFMRADAENLFDNEHADTMGAGIQLYVRTPEGSGAWLLVPEHEGRGLRVRAIAGWGERRAPRGEWRASGRGYDVRIELPTDASSRETPIDLDIVINETTHDRERRRGQLVLSGARGEFVYLRGDRHDAASLLPFLVVG